MLIGCTNVISHKCAAKHGIGFSQMSIDAVASFDRRGTQLLEEVDVPFPTIWLTINVTTDAGDQILERVREDLQRYCPVPKVIRNAGTVIEETWNVRRP